MNSSSLVSVVIPTYKRNVYLQHCLNSVYEQSHDNLEVIVVDDSGDEHAKEVTDQYNLNYISLEENQGPTTARNKGIEQASGDYIQLLDDDDTLNPNKIEYQLNILESSDRVGVVYCGFDEGGIVTRPPSQGRGNVLELCLKLDLPQCITSTMLVESSLLKMVSPLPETSGADDTYWKIEFAQRTEFDFVEEILVHRFSPDDRRQSSWGAIEGTYSIINEYEELYDTFPNNVQQRAQARAMRREALYWANNRLWSFAAINLYYQSLRIDPHPSVINYIVPITLLFGKLSFIPSQFMYRYIQSIIR